MGAPPRTLFDKVWDRHVVLERPDGMALVFIDRHFAHEGSFHAFNLLRERGLAVRSPERTVLTADHYVATRTGARQEPAIRAVIDQLGDNAAHFGLRLFGPGDPNQGIVHVIGPELGLTLPGLSIVCGDSHTATHGAFGALAFGIGATEVAMVLATQTLWQRRPSALRCRFAGRAGFGVGAKDLALALIARIGTAGGTGCVIEYCGEAVEHLSMEARMTLCNLTIEAGARAGMVAPDDVTFQYLATRPHAPKGAHWDDAVADWRTLSSDQDAPFAHSVELDAGAIAPQVSWGTSPDQSGAVTEPVPDPERMGDLAARRAAQQALSYMGLEPGRPLLGLPVDRVFIGSCTNARLEDLQAAAEVLGGRRVRVPTMVVPGSRAVRRAAERLGLDRVFVAAGAEWHEPGCSLCVGMNGDTVAPGQRCASTSNRNFPGRQGPGSRTHLMSPAMAAAAAVRGEISDVRALKSAT